MKNKEIDKDYYEVFKEEFIICGDKGVFHIFQKKDKSDIITWIEMIEEIDVCE